MNKQQLASKIWESANKMRSKIEANEYKDYILGFIFYKFLSEKQIELVKKDGIPFEELNEENQVMVKYIQDNVGYFISHDNLFNTWIEKGNAFDISNVTDALSAFNRLISYEHRRLFKDVFNTLETGLSKLGSTTQERTKAVRDLIHLIKEIPMDGTQDYDVLGFVYEYLISMFAANAGKKAGEFYTPHEVSVVMSEIVAEHNKNKTEISIYDPTSGSGSLLINIGRSVSKYLQSKDKIKYYAQELSQNTYNLTRMNLIMRGINPGNIYTRNADTLEDDWPYFDEEDPHQTYDPLYIDAVVSNPPYSQNWDPTNKETDPRYKDYGLAPRSKADYAFLLHDLYHVKPDGIMTIVLPHGVLFRGGQEGEIRKNLIENNKIDAIIGLPANIFFGTGIPTIIMTLKHNRDNNGILFVDASKGFVKEGKNNVLRASDIRKIVDTVIKRESTDKYSRVVSREEIRENDYNLNIPRYVDTTDEKETYDIYASMFGGIPNKEINELNKYWKVFPSLKNELFKELNKDYSEIKTEDIYETIKSNNDYINFNNKFNDSFNNLGTKLNEKLIDNLLTLNITQTKEEITELIFSNLEDISLVDKYQAYQLFDDKWNTIELDLETIQSTGLDALNLVEPKMVTRKKGSTEEQVQNGWVGKIFPFDLIQELRFNDELSVIKENENRMSTIAEEITEIFEAIDEEDKAELLNDSETAFSSPKLAAKQKRIIEEYGKNAEFEEDSIEYRVNRVINLNSEDRELKRINKNFADELEEKTKDAILSLSQAEALDILRIKWIESLSKSLLKLPTKIVSEFEKKLRNLTKKYEETLLDIENEIVKTSNELSNMLNDLVGDEFSMKGIEKLKKTLLGDMND